MKASTAYQKNLEQDNMKDMAAMLQEYTVKGVAYYYVLGV